MTEVALESDREDRLRGTDRLVLLLLTLVLLLPGVFRTSLIDRDEGWYAQVSREMLAGGDWLVPHYLGEPWLAKPPLLYWCVAGSFWLLGVSAGAARLVSVLATAGAVQCLAALGADFYGRRAALFGAVAFLTAGLPVVVGKLVLTDGLLLVGCLGAVLALWRGAMRGMTWTRAAAFWLAVGLGVLAKGPAVFLFTGAFGLGLLTRPAWRGALGSGRLWAMSLVGLAVAVPWYALVAREAGPALSNQFLGYEVLSRITGAPHGHTGPPGYHLLVALAGWLPWTPLLPGAVIEAWRDRRRDARCGLLLWWWALPWLVLELVRSKLPHYTLPAYVPLALLFGRMWDAGLRGAALDRARRVVLQVWAVIPVVLGAVLLGLAVAGHDPTWGWAAGLCGGVLAIGFTLVAVNVRRQRLAKAWAVAVGSTGVFWILLGAGLLPSLEPYRISRRLAERANELAGDAAPVLVCGYTEPTLFFYLERWERPVPPDRLKARLNELSEPAVCLIRAAELEAAGLEPGPDWERISGFNYVKGRRETVWLGRILPGRGGS